MTAPFSEVNTSLTYPIYGCDFDPQDPNRLVVGGGGGAGRSGVGNAITVLSVTHESIDKVSEANLSRDEDNVTTLAVAQRKLNNKTNLVYAGINSSVEAQRKGKNEHLRVFGADQPSARTTKISVDPKLAELSRTALFASDAAGETYQRLLRLSQPFPGVSGSQLGAVATGIATQSEIALFEIPAQGPNLVPKGRIELKKEAIDMDVVQVTDDTYRVLYCDDYELYAVDVSSKTGAGDPVNIYTLPEYDPAGGVRPIFRCLRFLSPTFAVAVGNLPPSKGAVMFGFRLPKVGVEGKARIATNAKLDNGVGGAPIKATGLAVVNLSPRTSATAKQGDAQFVIAVATSDLSLAMYTLDHSVSGDLDLIANMRPFTTFKKAHAGLITSLAFAPFIQPTKSTGRVLSARLASVSVNNEVSVHEIPLKKTFSNVPGTAQRKPVPNAPHRQPRYVIAAKSKGGPPKLPVYLLVGVIAILLGVFVRSTNVSWRDIPAQALTSWDALPTVGVTKPHRVKAEKSSALAELLARHRQRTDEKADWQEAQPVMIISSGSEGDAAQALKLEDHDLVKHGQGLRWEDLTKEQQERWMETLKAGQEWTEAVPNSVFKGILFSELAGAVAGMVGN